MEWTWTDMRERKPEREDADVYGCVVVWHRYQGVMVMGWREAARNRFALYWSRPPGPPEGIVTDL